MTRKGLPDNENTGSSNSLNPFDGLGSNPMEGNDPYLDESLMGAFTQPVARASDIQRVRHADEQDLSDLNNPDMVTLTEPPLIGGRTPMSNMYGHQAETFGRMSSPKLYASAAQHPGATQFRVWRMENGIPVGIGVIDAECTEEDFIDNFFPAMPKDGEGKTQFRLRPIDVRGHELGKEFPIVISEHHARLRHLREREKNKENPSMFNSPFGPQFGGGFGRQGGDVIVNPPAGAANDGYAEEMGRMFEKAVEAADERTRYLQETLEEERERLRMEEKQKAEERVHMAEKATSLTEKMMERVMLADKSRADEALRAQQQHSSVVTSTLTTVFNQQQEAARIQAAAMREMDEQRMTRDRDYFERQRLEAEERRRQDREEFERKRQLELDQIRLDNDRREKEIQARLEREKGELEQRRAEVMSERERIRQEAEDRRAAERADWERKLELMKHETEMKRLMDKEEREARERRDLLEREAREKAEQLRRDMERMEWERKETLRREELQREADRRREEVALQMKQLETQAQRDREHAERMAQAAEQERAMQREAMERRDKLERETREEQERQRQRQHDMEMRRLEQQAAADREHQERMLQLSRMQNSGGLSGLTDMLGMDAGEALERIFGGGGGGGEEAGGGGGMVEGAVKILGSLAEMAKMAMEKNAATMPPSTKVSMGPTRRPDGLVEVQTAAGPRLITEDQLRAMQEASVQRQRAPVAVTVPAPALPQQVSPSSQQAPAASKPVEPIIPENELQVSADFRAALSVNTSERAKAAGLGIKDIKNGRVGLRALSKKLPSADEKDWQGIVMEALVSNPAIIKYIEAVSLYAALVETKADAELIEHVVTMIRTQAPGAIPINEADIEKRATEMKNEAPVEDEADA